jgi:uncharacterized protein YqjF (DUF2071 family)
MLRSELWQCKLTPTESFFKLTQADMAKSSRPFLTAQWTELIMLNWAVPRELLDAHVPVGTELDLFEGRAYVSVVAFRFRDTRVCGIPIPFHINFPEVNLRFYVIRKVGDEVRRGVVFRSELVPRFWIAFVARTLYNERYSAIPMSADVAVTSELLQASYRWGRGSQHGVVTARADNAPEPLQPGSRYEFIAEHYFGYASQRNGSTLEYVVEHRPWRAWTNCEVSFQCDIARWYGEEWVSVLSQPPDFSFVAEGSPVAVYAGKKI